MPPKNKPSRSQLRRDVAVLHQTSRWPVSKIVKSLFVSRAFVYKWKDKALDDGPAFDDQPRSGRPKAIAGRRVRPFRLDVEKDG